jgi:hypothetical protein
MTAKEQGFTLAEVAAFLDGSALLDGVWFGEPHPTDPGPWWWRKHLTAALASDTGERGVVGGWAEAGRELYEAEIEHDEAERERDKRSSLLAQKWTNPGYAKTEAERESIEAANKALHEAAGVASGRHNKAAYRRAIARERCAALRAQPAGGGPCLKCGDEGRVDADEGMADCPACTQPQPVVGGRDDAERDADIYGTGFLVDGKRVAPDRVQIIARTNGPTFGQSPAAFCATPPESGGQGWRPIESAPRDGTAIWVAGYMEHAESWNCGCAKWEDDGYSRAGWIAWGTSRFGASGLSAPTHWQHLPAAPAQPDGVSK